jgi:hypothetical protein
MIGRSWQMLSVQHITASAAIASYLLLFLLAEFQDPMSKPQNTPRCIRTFVTPSTLVCAMTFRQGPVWCSSVHVAYEPLKVSSSEAWKFCGLIPSPVRVLVQRIHSLTFRAHFHHH